MHNVGQYNFVVLDEKRKLGEAELRVVLYGAYNAFGLIGPELNGIAILMESPQRCVILDEHRKAAYGWYEGYGGPTMMQLTGFEDILKMPDEDLLHLIRTHPCFRGTDLTPFLPVEQGEAT